MYYAVYAPHNIHRFRSNKHQPVLQNPGKVVKQHYLISY